MKKKAVAPYHHHHPLRPVLVKRQRAIFPIEIPTVRRNVGRFHFSKRFFVGNVSASSTFVAARLCRAAFLLSHSSSSRGLPSTWPPSNAVTRRALPHLLRLRGLLHSCHGRWAPSPPPLQPLPHCHMHVADDAPRHFTIDMDTSFGEDETWRRHPSASSLRVPADANMRLRCSRHGQLRRRRSLRALERSGPSTGLDLRCEQPMTATDSAAQHESRLRRDGNGCGGTTGGDARNMTI